MASHFVNIDRRTPMLLPADMREWVADDDVVHFVLEAVEAISLETAAVNVRGTGSDQYPPSMMLALLIYCYAEGIFSSRQIERATHRHLSVRYVSGNTHPDPDTIATFRRANAGLIGQAFVQVLRLARELGLCRLGTISVDGTKVRAAASKRRTLRAAELEEEMGRLQEQVGELMRQAQRAEEQEAQRDNGLPAELIDRQKRLEKLQAARRALQQRTVRRAEQREEERKNHGEGPGKPPRSLPREPRASDCVNTTDVDSGLMPTAREGFVQGYNGQIAVDAQSGLIVAARVSPEVGDRRELVSTVGAVPRVVGTPKVVLADSGYDNQGQVAAVERSGETLVYCAPQRGPKRLGKRLWPVTGRRDRRMAQARNRMRKRIESASGRALYRLRSLTVEPMIGLIKQVLGFRRFSLRGLPAVNLEWQLVAVALNCRRLASVWAASKR